LNSKPKGGRMRASPEAERKGNTRLKKTESEGNCWQPTRKLARPPVGTPGRTDLISNLPKGIKNLGGGPIKKRIARNKRN